MENEDETTGSFPDLANYPEELIIMIFSNLEFDDLCRAGRVCSRWYILSRCQSLRETVDCHHRSLTSEQIGKLFKILGGETKFLRIRSLSSEEQVPNFSLMKERCCNLETLLLERVKMTLSVTVRDLPSSVTMLSFRTCDVFVENFFREYGEISRQTNLTIKVLNITDCRFFTYGHIVGFSKCNLSGLQELYVTGCDIADDGLNELAGAITQLRVLDLENTHVGGRENSLNKLSKSCTLLEELYLGGTTVTDRILRTIQAPGFPKLRRICLQGAETSYAGHRYLLSVVPTLEYINENSRVDVMKTIIENDDQRVCDHFFLKKGFDVSELTVCPSEIPK